jgi:acyl-CoA hydrolase
LPKLKEDTSAWFLKGNLEGLILMNFSGHSLPVRTVAESQSEMTELILPNDTNTLGNLLGGRLMHFIDLVGAMAAYRHSRTHVVTASMDHIDFIAPVHVGDLLILKSSLNRAFNTSMEVGVKVWVENTIAGTHRHVASAYLTFVAVDSQGRRVPVPGLKPETEEEKRRYEDAGRRREIRQKELAHKRAGKAAEMVVQGRA